MNAGRTVGHFEQQHGQGKIKQLKEQVAAEKAKVEALASKRAEVTIPPSDRSNTIKFGVISDTHFGSLYSCPENLKAFYDACQHRGVKTVLHAGDVLDGWRIYKGQEFELRDVGFSAQLDRFEQSAPRVKGIKTLFITGNHDSSFTGLTGINVGEALENARPDWDCIGHDYGVVKFATKNGAAYSVALWHPDGGCAYALSYRGQRHIEALEGGKKANMVCFGHYHKSEMMPSYRNVCGVNAGCFCWQTPFMQRKGSAAHVGGWIFDVMPGASWNAIQSEFIAFYR